MKTTYNNSLTPSTLFGIVLLLLALTTTAIWLGALFDSTAQAFDVPGVIVLGLGLGSWLLSFLFFARVRWVRVTTSVLLHALIVVLAAVLCTIGIDHGTVGMKVFVVALFFLGAGVCVVGILVLHSRAMKVDLAGQTESPAEAAR